MMLHKKLSAALIAATLMSMTFVAHAGEYVHCTFKHPDGRDGTFNFSKSAGGVVSDFGDTSFWRDEHLQTKGPIDIAANLGSQCGGNDGDDNYKNNVNQCDTRTLLCFLQPKHDPTCSIGMKKLKKPEDSRDWVIMRQDDKAGNWLIRGTIPQTKGQTKEKIDVRDAKCTSSPTNPNKKSPF